MHAYFPNTDFYVIKPLFSFQMSTWASSLNLSDSDDTLSTSTSISTPSSSSSPSSTSTAIALVPGPNSSIFSADEVNYVLNLYSVTRDALMGGFIKLAKQDEKLIKESCNYALTGRSGR